MAGSGRPTLQDVARLAGVAPVTVSRVVNSSGSVKEKTRKKVMSAVAELGYVPNRLAGALASARSRAISLIVPSTYLGTFHFLNGIVKTAAQAGYNVTIGFTGDSNEEIGRVAVEALSSCPEGIIFIGGMLNETIRKQVLATQIPVVEAWEIPRRPIDMAVGYSIADLAEKMAGHIIDKGYRRPFLAWAAGTRASLLRFGISQAMLESGREEPQFVNFEFPGKFPQGVEVVQRLKEMDPRPDILLCISDWLAHGAMMEAQRIGWSIPDDLAIWGFGNEGFGAHLRPSLSTVELNGDIIGSRAVSMLLTRLQNRPLEEKISVVPANIILRESC